MRMLKLLRQLGGLVLGAFNLVSALPFLPVRLSVQALKRWLKHAETVAVDLKAQHGLAVQVSFKILFT